MCYSGICPNENHTGDCRGRPYGKCPDDEGYEEAVADFEAAQDAKAEELQELNREWRNDNDT